MQREIKFRFWYKLDNKMFFTADPKLGQFSFTLNGILSIKDLSLHMNTEIMQYTGLKDRNGIDIYEGDIIKADEGVSYIEYYGKSFWAKDESFGWEGEGLWDWNNFEVIGNIYEHKYLLDENKND